MAMLHSYLHASGYIKQGSYSYPTARCHAQVRETLYRPGCVASPSSLSPRPTVTARTHPYYSIGPTLAVVHANWL